MTGMSEPAAMLPLAGVELGGTKCICTLAFGPDAIVVQETVPTTDPAETLGRIEAILDAWWRRPGFRALGIASFGPVDLDRDSPRFGFITSTAKPLWNDTDVGRRLGARWPVPMAFDTDVNGAALAERRWGAAQGFDDFAYVTVGTGVGVGLIVNGRPTRGLSHCELGHIRVPRLPGDDWAGSCPYHGDCVEGLASGTAIKAMLGGAEIGTIGADHPAWDRVVAALAALCHTLTCAAGPQRIAIGGGVIAHRPHLLNRIEPALRASLNGYMTLPETRYVVSPQLGAQAGPLGPIALAEMAGLHQSG